MRVFFAKSHLFNFSRIVQSNLSAVSAGFDKQYHLLTCPDFGKIQKRCLCLQHHSKMFKLKC